MRILLIITCLFLSISASAQNRILVDGEFDDWTNVTVANSDANGDAGSSGIDFKVLKFSNDENYFFIYLETGKDINLQDLNDVAVYIDIDNNAQTGANKSGIGAELTYTFGKRSGTYNFTSGGSTGIRHNDIGLITAPTVTSSAFEIAIKRSFIINGSAKSMKTDIRVVIADNANGDQTPGNSGGVSYTFVSETLDALPTFAIKKSNASHLRLLSYNVERGRLV